MKYEEKKALERKKTQALTLLGFKDLLKEKFFDNENKSKPDVGQIKMMLACVVIDRIIKSETKRYPEAKQLSDNLVDVYQLMNLKKSVTDIQKTINQIDEPIRFYFFYETKGSKLKKTLSDCLNKYCNLFDNDNPVDTQVVFDDFCQLYQNQISAINPEKQQSRNRQKSANKI